MTTDNQLKINEAISLFDRDFYKGTIDYHYPSDLLQLMRNCHKKIKEIIVVSKSANLRHKYTEYEKRAALVLIVKLLPDERLNDLFKKTTESFIKTYCPWIETQLVSNKNNECIPIQFKL